ncbi:MAG: protein kinase [Anaerolineales bacterium]|nr:protein kinase [Anaerolineales bacterium]
MYPNFSGQRFGQYELQSIIGRGGMALVYRARQINLNRDVAVKIIGGQAVGKADFIARFKREADLIARLEHPHILPIYDYGQEGEFLYLVLRLMEGGSLDRRILGHPLPLNDIDRLIKQIASALDYAHSHEVVHRDLKPNNILLDNFGNAYLMDFGIAKILGGTQMTSTSTLMGTPSYMAPEQWKLDPVDHRADVYSLGVILYEMLTGKVPFDAPTPHQLMYAHLHKDIPRPSESLPGLLPAIDKIILKATAKTREDRYSTAGELANALSAAIASQAVDARGDFTPLTMRPVTMIESLPTTAGMDDPMTRNLGGTPVAPRPIPAARQTIPPPMMQSQSIKHRRGLTTLVLVGGLIGIAVVLFMLFSFLNREDKENTTPIPTTALVAAENTTEAPATDTPTLTTTPSPTPDDGIAQTSTTDAIIAITQTAEITNASDTPEPSDNIATFVQMTIEAVESSTLTATSESPTNTLPPTYTQTTVPNTATPTTRPTNTATNTSTPSVTPTQTASATVTSSPTPTRTATPSLTATFTRPAPTNTPFFLAAQPTAVPASYCTGKPVSQVSVGVRGRVTYTDGTVTNLRTNPGGEVQSQMAEGTPFDIVGGPACTADYTWWQIKLDSGVIGWVAESDASRYFIEIDPTFSRPSLRVLQIAEGNEAAMVFTTPNSAGTIITRLGIGDRVAWDGYLIAQSGSTWAIVKTYDNISGYLLYRPDLVTEVDPYATTAGVALNETVTILPSGDFSSLRVTPDTSADRIRLLRQGTVISVIDGPFYQDYVMWWKFQLSDNTTGWLADIPGWFSS